MSNNTSKSLLSGAFIFLLLGSWACQNAEQKTYDAYNYRQEKHVKVKEAAVASAHPLASAVGKSILEQGGNAIDAAIAVQYALAVVYPGAGNIGGGGFMVIHSASGEETTFDYREKAPGSASRDMYLDSLGNAIPSKSRDGHLASGVPGTVAGLFQAHAKFGKLPMEALIQPAIDLANEGFRLTEREAKSLNKAQEDFIKYNQTPIAFVKDQPWAAGDTLIQKDLGATLERIRDKGKAGFYEGKTAALVVEEMQRGGGIISLEDLKGYQAEERAPVVFDYKEYQILTMGLPSSGGVMQQQMLGMLEDYPIADYGHNTPEAVQLMTEIERRAFADRTEYMGDPDFVDVPVSALVDKAYLKSRMEDYDPGHPTPSTAVKPGLTLKESEETTHLSVVDGEGNAVSVTTTLNGVYGSRVVVGGAGFLLNNEMDDFSAKPGAPNKFGLLGTEANKIEPQKRMLSSMTPTIVLKDGKPYLVLGTPGGSTIITSVFQTLVNLLEFDLSVDDAVNKPKFHHQWMPDIIEVEKGFPDSTRNALTAMGYKITERSSIGRTEVIKITPEGVEAVADHRGDDSAAGF